MPEERLTHPVMNDTKWRELRSAMLSLGELSPRWRTLDLENGYLSAWDGEWYHHFSLPDCKFIEWLELAVETELQRAAVLRELVRIRLPGEHTANGFKVFGFIEAGKAVDCLSIAPTLTGPSRPGR